MILLGECIVGCLAKTESEDTLKIHLHDVKNTIVQSKEELWL